MRKFTNTFHKSRVAKERTRAIAALKREGVIPTDWVDGKLNEFKKMETETPKTEVAAAVDVSPTVADSKSIDTNAQPKIEAAIAEVVEKPKQEEAALGATAIETTREVKHCERITQKEITSIPPRKDAPAETMSMQGVG